MGDVELYTFTNGWSMQREPERPWYWMLCDADGQIVDRDQYRHDVMPRHGLTIASHKDPTTKPRSAE